MIKQAGVIDSASPSEETPEDPSGEGEIPSKTGDRPELNVLREQNRKLQESLDRLLSEKEDRLSELQEKGRLSQSEKSEMESIEEQISAITSDPKSKPWLKLSEKTSRAASREEIETLDQEIALDYAAECAEKEGMKYEDFEKKIVRYVPLTDPKKRQFQRMKEAYRLYKRDQDISNREAKLVEREKNFVDTGKVPAQKTLSREEALKRASSDESSMKALLKSIAGRQKKEQEALK